MISEALRLIRVFHDLKQSELAARLEMSKSYLSEIEAGKKTPTIDLIEKYADIFHIPASSILFFSENLRGAKGKKTNENARTAIAQKILSFLKIIEARTETDGKKAS